VAVNSFFLLVGSLFIASHVLGFFGFGLPVVRVAGGLIVTAFGWKLLNVELEPTTADGAPVKTLPDPFCPLTMPLTVESGSIFVAITPGSQRLKTVGLEQFAVLAAGGHNGIGPDGLSLVPVCPTTR
jgi:multiple antibiotic resistance protein